MQKNEAKRFFYKTISLKEFLLLLLWFFLSVLFPIGQNNETEAMIRILGGNSEHVAYALRKICLFG